MAKLALFILFLLVASLAKANTRFNIDQMVQLHCDDPTMAKAIITIESNYKNVVSTEGSIGYMQVKYSTAKWIGCGVKKPSDLLDGNTNIACGCRYLRYLKKTYKSPHRVIVSYNAGSPRVCKTGVLYPSGKKCRVGAWINQPYLDKYQRTWKVINGKSPWSQL